MRKEAVAFAAFISVVGTGANAQVANLVGKIFGVSVHGEANGRYQSDRRIRADIIADPTDETLLYDKLVAKSSDMAAAKGYPRIGVTKASCATVFVSHSPRYMVCKSTAVMLNQQEAVGPRGDRVVRYYDVDDVRRNVVDHDPHGGAAGLPGRYVTTSNEGRSERIPAPVVHAPSPIDAAPMLGTPAPKPTSAWRSVARDGATELTSEQRFQQAMKANQPVRGRDPIYGATISD